MDAALASREERSRLTGAEGRGGTPCSKGDLSGGCRRKWKGATRGVRDRQGRVTRERHRGGTHGGALCAGLERWPPKQAVGAVVGGGWTVKGRVGEWWGSTAGPRKTGGFLLVARTQVLNVSHGVPSRLQVRRRMRGLMLRPLSCSSVGLLEQGGVERARAPLPSRICDALRMRPGSRAERGWWSKVALRDPRHCPFLMFSKSAPKNQLSTDSET